MGTVGQIERKTQNRVVKLFCDDLGYNYLGNLENESNNRNIDEKRLSKWLLGRGHSDTLVKKALRELGKAAALGGGRTLYDANK